MEQENLVLCGANSYEQKYYLNQQFSGLPEQVRQELQIMCVLYTCLLYTSAPQGWAGKTLRELDLRKKGLNVIARKNGDEVEMQLDPDRTLSAEDKFILVGDNNALERLYA